MTNEKALLGKSPTALGEKVPKKKKTIYQRIIAASEARPVRGVRMTPDEVIELSMDKAVRTAAENDSMDDEDDTEWSGWVPCA